MLKEFMQIHQNLSSVTVDITLRVMLTRLQRTSLWSHTCNSQKQTDALYTESLSSKMDSVSVELSNHVCNDILKSSVRAPGLSIALNR